MRKHQVLGREALNVSRARAGWLTPVRTAMAAIFVGTGLFSALPAMETAAPAGAAVRSTVGALPGATCVGGLGSGSPGVTAKNINVASISSQTGPLSGDFSQMVPGVKAYFDYIDAHGGVNGRKITLAYQLDDGSNPSQFSQLTHTAIDQDHAFAAVGVASAFFAPNLFTESCIPTYGYNVTSNWSDQANLFAAGGSALYTLQVPAEMAYLMRQDHLKSFATLAYGGVPESSGVCAGANEYLTRAGFTQSYTDLNISYGGNITPDVQRMRTSGAQLVLSCMDVTQNIQLAQDIKKYGLKTKQYWLNGSDRGVLTAYGSVMQGVYSGIQQVPFTAPTKYYPAMATYLAAMKKYEPAYTYDDLAIQGWSSAALFAEGVKLAGTDLTQANVIKQTNLLTAYNVGGLYSVVNWTTAHTQLNSPFCEAFIQAKGTYWVPVFGKGHQVFVCLNVNKSNPTPRTTHPVPAPPGTPGS
ncbi:MAG TPA: ABC transporter substrate-binding protein [Acidimicrobiales bacterium]|jgi:ABC-type branched-subunit amino acid transport system substrate-binding protein